MRLAAPEEAFVRRWAVYCSERFPPLQHGVVIAAFAFATLAVASAGRNGVAPLGAGPLAIGFAIAFLAFLELRILDEFKDADDDARYRPYRPVPRGLVTLRELRAAGAAAVAVQLALAALAGPAALAALFVAFVWMALMGREFFASAWLRARPLVYVALHTIIVPLLALVVAACSGRAPDLFALAPFLALTYASSVVFEFGRKIRAPADERVGVETYSALWGPRSAAIAWWMALAISALLAVATAAMVGDPLPIAALAAVATAVAAMLAARFVSAPSARTSGRIRACSGLWLVAAYVAIGVVALPGAMR